MVIQPKCFNVGLIGLGFIGKIHALAYHAIPHAYPKPPVFGRVASVLRSQIGTEGNLLSTIGNPTQMTDMASFFDTSLDLVDICTPNALHLEQASAAAARRLPIYCEKPLGLNLAHTRQITEKVKQAVVPTHTAFVMRYYPAVQQARAVLNAGVLGEITNFRAHLFHNSYIDPLRPTSWRLRRADSGGGSMADLGIHVFDLVRYLLGEARWVQCRTRTFIAQRPVAPGSGEMVPVDVDDWGICLLGLENGAQGAIEATRMSGGMGDSTRVEIFGSRGSLDIDLENPLRVRYYDQSSQRVMVGEQDFHLAPGDRPITQLWPPAKTSLGFFRDAHMACIMDFLLNLQENKPSMVDFPSALRSQEILEAAYLSAGRDGQTIPLPLE